MAKFREMNAAVSLADQLQQPDDGPVVLINVFTVDPADADALVAAWAHDAHFMKQQPGYVSTQLHEGVAGSSTFVNYAVWESVSSFRAAFTNPEFQSRIRAYPESAEASPHLFRKRAVPGFCVA
ncbi:MAG: antibiotic biosynthesis monooxygenase family protein [Pseudomonadota bacterium]